MAVIMAQSVAAAAASRRGNRPSLHVSAIIAAGGRGSRLGAGQPKQLLEISGVPDPAAQRGCVPASPARDRGGGGVARRRPGGAAAVPDVDTQAGDPGRRRRQAPGLGRAGVRAGVAGRRHRGGARRRAADGLGGSDRPHRGSGRRARRGAGRAASDRHRQARRTPTAWWWRRCRAIDLSLAQTPQAFQRRGPARRAGERRWTPPTRRRWSSVPAFPCTWSPAIPAT